MMKLTLGSQMTVMIALSALCWSPTHALDMSMFKKALKGLSETKASLTDTDNFEKHVKAEAVHRLDPRDLAPIEGDVKPMSPRIVRPWAVDPKRNCSGYSMYGCIVDKQHAARTYYHEYIPEEDRELMTKEVCWRFCKDVPGASFFGLEEGRYCYCTPFWHIQRPRALYECNAVCEGDKKHMCGGMKEALMYEMHDCSNLPPAKCLTKPQEVVHATNWYSPVYGGYMPCKNMRKQLGDSLGNRHCTIECKPGFQLVVNTLVCREKGNRLTFSWGEWHGHATCESQSCGIPRKVDHTTYSNAEVFFPGSVLYSCIDGYSVGGRFDGPTSFQVNCTETGEFVGYTTCVKYNCGYPPAAAKARLRNQKEEFVEFKSGEKVEYLCTKGHSLTREFNQNLDYWLTCQPNGKFTEAPDCLPISCNKPPFWKSATAENPPAEMFYEDKLTYTCNTGYSLDKLVAGPDNMNFEVECQFDGKYSPKWSPCARILCGTPKPYEYATWTPTYPVAYQSKIKYTCLDGYRIPSSEAGTKFEQMSTRCAAGKVITTRSECQEAFDALSLDPNNLAFYGPDHIPTPGCMNTDGDKSICRTEATYYRSHDFQAVCGADGQYIIDFDGECVPVRCGQAPDVSNAGITDNCANVAQCEHPEFVHYNCTPGYSGRANDDPFHPEYRAFSVQCLETGLFTKPMACVNINNCWKENCGKHGECTDNPVPTGIHHQDYSCNCIDGYEQVTNDGVNTCADINDCPPTSSFAYKCSDNGKCHDRHKSYQCQCNNGYMGVTLVNTQNATCAPVKATLPTVADATIDDPDWTTIEEFDEKTTATYTKTTDVVYGHPRTFTCDSGFTVNGNKTGASSFQVSVSVGGAGTPTLLPSPMKSCNAVCCGAPYTIAHADPTKHVTMMHYSKDRDSRTIGYNCHSGYTTDTTDHTYIRDASFEVECQASGEKSAAGQCVPVHCGNNPQVENAEAPSYGNLAYPNSVRYNCNYGYSLDASNRPDKAYWIMSCQANGTKTATKTCQPVNCGKPPVVAHGTCPNPDTEVTYNQEVTFTAVTGYSLDGKPDGPKTVTTKCLPNTSFSEMAHLLPFKPISCGTPNIVLNSYYAKVPLTYQQTMAYTCHTGYSTDSKPVPAGGANGFFVATCEANGDYSGLMTCNPVVCETLPTPAGATLTPAGQTGITYGNSSSFLCNPGYALTTTGGAVTFEVACQADGTFAAHDGCSNLNDCSYPNASICALDGRGTCKDKATPTGVHINDYECECSSGFEQSTIEAGYVASTSWCRDAAGKISNHYQKIVTSEADCRAQCNSDPGCAGYNYRRDENSNDKLCKIWHPTVSSVPSGWDVVAGNGGSKVTVGNGKSFFSVCMVKQALYRGPKDPKCYKSGPLDFGGYNNGDIGAHMDNVPSAQACQELCYEHPQCGVFVYSKALKRCWRKCAVGVECSASTNGATQVTDLPQGSVSGPNVCKVETDSFERLLGGACRGANGVEPSRCYVAGGSDKWVVNCPSLCAADENCNAFQVDKRKTGPNAYGCIIYTDSACPVGMTKTQAGPQPVSATTADDYWACFLKKTATAALPPANAETKRPQLYNYLSQDVTVAQRYCRNIDNCPANDGCKPGTCEDLVGGYQCHCPLGYHATGTPQTCEPQQCGDPPTVTNAAANDTGTQHYGDVLKYTCNEGYTLNGTATGLTSFTVTCEGRSANHSSGTFTNEYLTKSCQPVSCGDPPTQDHASGSISHEMKFPMTITFSCDQGYTTDGACQDTKETYDMKCNKDGVYEYDPAGTTKSCQAVDCGIPNLANAQYKEGRMYYPETREVECNTGYSTDGQDHTAKKFNITAAHTCEIAIPYTCTIMNCGAAPAESHSTNNKGSTELKYEDTVTYTGNTGYTLNGKHDGTKEFTVKCQANGQIETEPDLPFLPVECGMPDDVAHASWQDVEKTYSETVTYTCHNGYTTSGKYSEGITTFDKMCKEDGNYATQAYKEFNNYCVSHLNDNHLPQDGDSAATKDACAARCDAVSGCTAFEWYESGSGGYKCYLIKGSTPATKGSSGDQWKDAKCYVSVGVKLACEPYSEEACRQAALKAGLATGGAGHTFSGNFNTKGCYTYPSGQYFGKAYYGTGGTEEQMKGPVASDQVRIPAFDCEASCRPVECGEPPAKDYSTKPTSEVQYYTDTVKYTCLPGYGTTGLLDGNDEFTLTCGAQGTFSGHDTCKNEDDCAGNMCGAHGTCWDKPSPTGVHLDDYKCNCSSGFEEKVMTKAGKQYHTCGNIPDCPAEACLPGVCKDKINGYECDCPRGYYEGQNPPLDKDCLPEKCGKAPAVDHASHEKSNLDIYYLDIVDYTCDPGYTLDGSASGTKTFEIMCNLTAEGSSSVVDFTAAKECKIVSCGDIPTKNYATADKSGPIYYEQEVRYTCDTGYTTSGTCNGVAFWEMKCLARGELANVGRDSEVKSCKPVSAGTPQASALPFCTFNAIEMKYGDEQVVRCDTGYVTDPSNASTTSFVLKAQSDCTFGNHPTCQPVNCGTPTVVANAKASTDAAAGTYEFVGCFDGNDMPKSFGDKPISIDGLESCRSGCASAGYEYFGGECAHMDTFTCRCGNGATAKGGTSVPIGKCAERSDNSCRGPYTVNGDIGTYVLGSGKYKSVYKTAATTVADPMVVYPKSVTYTADYCFTANGTTSGATSFTAQCQADGTFQSLVTFAPLVRISCGVPKKATGATPSTDEVKCGSKATYTCKSGYSTNGNPASTKVGNDKYEPDCLNSGLFEDVGACEKVECKKVPSFPNAKITDGGSGKQLYGDQIHVECNAGYSVDAELTGETRFYVRCEANGRFSKAETCQNMDDCAYSTCGEHGSCEDNQNPTGRHVDDYTCHCDSGFQEVVNENGRVCVNIDDCKEDSCDVEHTYISGTCVDKVNAYECICPAGSYPSSDKTDCLPQSCGDVPTVDHSTNAFLGSGSAQPIQYFNQTYNYTCSTGYTVDGTPDGSGHFTVECQGKPSPNTTGTRVGLTTCKPVSCGDSPTVINATASRPSFVYPQEVVYTCELGFSTKGKCNGVDGSKSSFTIKCTETGEDEFVDSEHTECVGNIAGRPSIANAQLSDVSMRYPETQVVTCLAGYSTVASDKTKTSFTLSTAVDCAFADHPDCVPIECGTAPAVTYSAHTPTGTTFGSKITYTCEDGYTLDGNPMAAVWVKKFTNEKKTCEGPYDTVWSATTEEECKASCEANPNCGGVFLITDATTEKRCLVMHQNCDNTRSATYLGDTYALEMPFNGFYTDCTADGSYERAQECKPVDCGTPPTIDKATAGTPPAKFEYKGPSLPSQVTYTCDPGYTLDGTPSGASTFGVGCKANGQPSNVQICKIISCSNPPAVKGNARLNASQELTNVYSKKNSLGTRGIGKCECPNGAIYLVSDNKDYCATLACENGVASDCKMDDPARDSGKKMHVSCGTGPPKMAYTIYDGDCHGHESQTIDDLSVTECESACDSTSTCKGFSYSESNKRCVLKSKACTPDEVFLSGSFFHLKATPPPVVVDYAEKITYTCNPGYSVTDPTGKPPTSVDEMKYNETCQADGTFSNSGTCTDINWCLTGDGYCGIGGTCKDQLLDYTCICKDGYTAMVVPDSNGVSRLMCVDKNECEDPVINGTAKCTENGNCTDGIDKFTCDCEPGYKMEKINDKEQKCVPIMCQKVPKVKNCSSHPGMGKEHQFPTHVVYQCNAGYTTSGQYPGEYMFYVDCQTDGSYKTVKIGDETTTDPAIPECKPVECPELPDVANADVTKKTMVFGTPAVPYTCRTGYTTTGNPSGAKSFDVTCLATGQLSGILQCDPVVCGHAPDITHATYTAVCVPYSEDACRTAALKLGFALGSDTQDFTGSYTTKGCYTYSTGVNVNKAFYGTGGTEEQMKETPGGQQIRVAGWACEGDAANMVFGDTRDYKCNDGYTTTGTASGATEFIVGCGADGSHTNTKSCSPVSCGAPPDYDDSTGDGTEKVFGQNHTVTCDTGYTVDGVASSANAIVLQCLKNGSYSWFGGCKPVSCGTPTSMGNADPTTTDEVVYPNHVEMTCKHGFSLDATLVGAKKFNRNCRANGQFQTAVGCLDINYCDTDPCGPGHCTDCSQNPDHQVCSSQASVSSAQQFMARNPTTASQSGSNGDYACECDKGYDAEYDENGTLTCKKNECHGEPCGSGGHCIDLSKSPQAVNGTYTCTCRSGYELSDEGRPYCNPVICDYSVPTVVNTETWSIEYGPHPRLYGNVTAEKGPKACEGHYYDENECAQVGCCKFENFLCVSAVGNNTCAQALTPTTLQVGDSVDYTCKTGFTVDGNAQSSKTFEATCSASGSFSNMLTCVPVACGDAPTVPLASTDVTGTITFISDPVPYSCQDGYLAKASPPAPTPVATFHLSCLANGSFSTAPVCDPKSCGPLTYTTPHSVCSVPSGTVMKYPQVATYTCDDGFESSKDRAKTFDVSCGADGNFTQFYTCGALTCSNGMKVNEQRRVDCPPGMTVTGVVTDATFYTETCTTDQEIIGTVQCKIVRWKATGHVTNAVNGYDETNAKVTLTAQLPVPTGDAVFEKTDAEADCKMFHDIPNQDACQQAANALGLTWKRSTYSTSKPRDCFFEENSGSPKHVYYNNAPGHRALSTPSASYGSLCYTSPGGFTEFRLFRSEATQYTSGDNRWTVARFEVYPTTDCSGPMVVQTGHSASVNSADANKIGDGNTDTAWRGDCRTCSAEEEWVEFTVATPVVPRCVKVYQCDETGSTAQGCGQLLRLKGRPLGSTDWVNIHHEVEAAAPGKVTKIESLGVVLAQDTSDYYGTVDFTMGAGNYTWFSAKPGYITSVQTVDLTLAFMAADPDGQDAFKFPMSPLLAEDEFRIVLQWGKYSDDIDTHVYFGKETHCDGGRFDEWKQPADQCTETDGCHIWFQNYWCSHGVIEASLDLDDITSYGPETTTIKGMGKCQPTYTDDCTIIFAVKNYEWPEDEGYGPLLDSGVVIHVYGWNKFIGSYSLPAFKKDADVFLPALKINAQTKQIGGGTLGPDGKYIGFDESDLGCKTDSCTGAGA